MLRRNTPNSDIAHHATRVGPMKMGAVSVGASLFPGRIDGVQTNWTLARLELDAPGVERVVRLRQVAEALGLKTIWSPSPVKFNGRICSRSELKIRVSIDATQDIAIMRGMEADGCLIAPTESLIMSVGGCAVVVMEYQGRVVAAHAGLKCFYDHELAISGTKTPNREHESVVEAAGRALTTGGAALDPTQLHVRVLFPLSRKVHTHSLKDTVHGANNERLHQHFIKKWGTGCGVRLEQDGHTLSFDTLAIVRAQCERYFKLDPLQVERVGPFADAIPYAHHTRLPGEAGKMRNLVVIKNLG